MKAMLLSMFFLSPTEPPEPKLPPPPVRVEKAVITADTRVTLDGKPCDLSDVPADAEVINLEVAADRKTVTHIDFRRKKP